MILEAVSVGGMSVNCYILAGGIGKKAIIIDPGDEKDKIFKVLDKHKLIPGMVVNTHGHYDHISEDDSFGVKVCVHKLDAPLLLDPMLNLSGLFSNPIKIKSEICFLEEGSIVSLDGVELKVLHTPGHTKGGISLLLQKPKSNIVFTGDTLFCQGIGRSDLPGGDEELLISSIREKLMTLPPETSAYPGHGESTTIGRERSNFL
ncbi:MAG: MBL fold metallo-hydrolase [Candidatus Omnitrophota bacterium]